MVFGLSNSKRDQRINARRTARYAKQMAQATEGGEYQCGYDAGRRAGYDAGYKYGWSAAVDRGGNEPPA